MSRPCTVKRRAYAGLWRIIRPLVLLTGVLLTGCYSLVPVRVESVTPPMRVRAHLSPAGSERIAPILGSARTTLDGRLVETTSEGFYLEVPAGEVQNGMRTEVLTQKILVSRSELEGLQRRQLDRTRTYIAAGIGVAVIGVAIAEALTGFVGSSDGQPPGGGGPEARIPLLVVPLR